MNTTLRTSLIAATVLFLPALALAQNGCTNSPENPTVVLALVGGAACCWTTVRGKISSMRKK